MNAQANVTTRRMAATAIIKAAQSDLADIGEMLESASGQAKSDLVKAQKILMQMSVEAQQTLIDVQEGVQTGIGGHEGEYTINAAGDIE